MFGGPIYSKESTAYFDVANSGHEMKTESQILMEKRKEHDARQAVKHKKDFMSFVVQVLKKNNHQKEHKMQSSDVRAILPVDERDERDPTTQEIGTHVQE